MTYSSASRISNAMDSLVSALYELALKPWSYRNRRSHTLGRPFLTLPAEIRLEIYQAYFAGRGIAVLLVSPAIITQRVPFNEGVIFGTPSPKLTGRGVHYNLLRTCHQIRAEAYAVLARRATLKLPNINHVPLSSLQLQILHPALSANLQHIKIWGNRMTLWKQTFTRALPRLKSITLCYSTIPGKWFWGRDTWQAQTWHSRDVELATRHLERYGRQRWTREFDRLHASDPTMRKRCIKLQLEVPVRSFWIQYQKRPYSLCPPIAIEGTCTVVSLPQIHL